MANQLWIQLRWSESRRDTHRVNATQNLCSMHLHRRGPAQSPCQQPYTATTPPEQRCHDSCTSRFACSHCHSCESNKHRSNMPVRSIGTGVQSNNDSVVKCRRLRRWCASSSGWIWESSARLTTGTGPARRGWVSWSAPDLRMCSPSVMTCCSGIPRSATTPSCGSSAAPSMLVKPPVPPHIEKHLRN